MRVFLVPTALASALVAAGCSTDLDGFGTKTSAVDQARVLNAPTASVESGPIPAPSAPAQTAAAQVAPAQTASAAPTSAPRPATGAAASTAGSAVTPTQTASAGNVPLTPPPVNPGGAAYAASGSQEQLSGAWTFSWDDGARTCPLTLSTARGASNGLAAQADISCPSEIFMTKGWDTLGSDLILQNHVGKVTARLAPAGPNRFVGVLADNNQSVVLTR